MTQFIRVSVVAITIALFGMVSIPAAHAASDECDAQIESELLRVEPYETGDHYVWQVTVTTEEDCAMVEFQLTLTIQPLEGDMETVVRMGSVKISDGSMQHQMRYEMEPNAELTNWEIVMTSCELCHL